MVLATPASGCSFFETKCARSFYFCFNVIAKCEIGSELGPFLLKSAFFLVIFNKGKKKNADMYISFAKFSENIRYFSFHFNRKYI